MNYFDCHADTLTMLSPHEDLRENTGNLDLLRVQKFADSYTQIFALWADRKAITGQPEQAFSRLYDKALSLMQEQSAYLAWCKDAEDLKKARQENKAAAFLSVEDISIMGNMADRIGELGIRFALLTWNYENEYACGAVTDQSKGLTRQGRALVGELRKQRVIVDISHLSDQGVEDLFQLTDEPLIASHSNVRAVCAHPRNLKKEQIQELIRRKGLMGLNFYQLFVGEKPGLADLLRHIDAVLELGGEDILAIGGDFDGCSAFADPVKGVQSIPDLKAALEQAGIGKAVTEKIFYENAHRFLLEHL